MNIFDIYLDKIKNLIIDLKKSGLIILPESLEGITVEIPPVKFNADISTNVAMFLSKVNKKSPLLIADQLVEKLKNEDQSIQEITTIKPGFINIKFKSIFWAKFIEEVNKNFNEYGINNKENKNSYLIEFVSANPTGPLHVGHCRGAILGDVISNVLKFNKHKVTKEYYVNDYGNQIINFTKSVYFRIREILFKEEFPDNDDLYPGDYLIDFANNIIQKKLDINYDNYDEIKDVLTQQSIDEALLLIKKNLASLGIIHDNFISEKNLVSQKEVDKVIQFLEKNNFIYKGKIKAPAGEDNANWVE